MIFMVPHLIKCLVLDQVIKIRKLAHRCLKTEERSSSTGLSETGQENGRMTPNR